jgi:hypothetical protein
MQSTWLSRLPRWAFGLVAAVSAATGFVVAGLAFLSHQNAIFGPAVLAGVLLPPALLLMLRRRGRRRDQPTTPGHQSEFGQSPIEVGASTGWPSKRIVMATAGVLAVAVFGIGIVRSLGDDLGLKVHVNEGRYINLVVITNVLQAPIRVLHVSVNGRDDCYQFRETHASTLKMGDQTHAGTHCDVIRVTVNTDKGSASYSFK